MTEGTFIEQPTDPHVRLRSQVLAGGTALSAPGPEVVAARAADFPAMIEDVLLPRLQEAGLVVVHLDQPLADEQFLVLGAALGTPMPETDPAVQPFVERGVILNLVSRHGHTSNVSLQPFATNFLTLHTESSGRRKEDQPRYIVLMCCEPGDDTTAAQTALVPMAAVERRLGEDQTLLLSRTKYRTNRQGPTIVRSLRGRSVFSFRDFFRNPLEWTCVDDDADEDTVNATISDLLAAMYTPSNVAGVHWSRGMLVIIDNTFFFHGKTAGRVDPAGSRRRHLKRLRIVRHQA